jgi:hypothetical protein
MMGRIPAGRPAAWRATAAGGIASVLFAALPLSGASASSTGPARPSSTIQSHRVVSPVPVFAYYYIWFNHSSWNRAKIDYPMIGTYSSSDPQVMRRQIHEAESAGITGFIVSWKDTPLNDQRLRLLMAVAAQLHFKLAIIYQGLDFYRRPLPVAQVASDFKTFAARYASSSVFYRLGGKPLTIWSGTWAYTHAQVAQVTGAVRPGVLVLSTEKSVAGFQRIADVTDGDAYYWSSINPHSYPGYGAKLNQMSRAIHGMGKYWVAPFAPGFDARLVGGQKVVPRNGGQTLRTEYATAVRSSPDVLGLISWNEFSENSAVEPSVRYHDQSLDVLRQLRGTTVPQLAGPAAPSDGNARPHVTASAAWFNVLRLAGFPIVLVIAVGLLGYARRWPLHRRSRQRTNT